MFIATISSPARAISVLLGGSGICQPRAEADVGALLLPRKRQTAPQACRSLPVASADSLWEVDRHD